ncbi:unnamed protein product, partial [Prorocentrum cordatum]
GVGPHDLNWSIFLCVPKGTEVEDTLDSCTRTASTVRTLSLKNADAKLIAACADRALQPIASSVTAAVQKSFTAGRRLVDHIPFLDAECVREGLLPGAAQRRPMLLSYDFRQAFPSLFRDVIDMVLPRYGVPIGFRSVVSALYCNCLAFSSFRASGASAVLEPLFALRCGIMQGCPLSGTAWCLGMDAPIRALIGALGDPPEGCLTACADDLGMFIRNARVLPSIASSFDDIEFAFNLQLTKEYLAALVPRWNGFRIDSSAKYLGTRIGPGVSEQGIWKIAAAKWWSRASELSRTGMATSLAAIAYNVNVGHPLHGRMVWLPRIAASLGLFPYSVGTLLRSAAHTVRDWVPSLHALHDSAVEYLPLVRVLQGSWSPRWWATKRSIVQSYGLVMDLFSVLPHPRPVLDKVPVPVPMSLIDAARRAMHDEELAAAKAVPPRKVKRQAVAMRTLRDGLYADRLDQLIGRRLRRRGLEVPAEQL